MNETGEIIYQGVVWKLATLADGGWRMTIDLTDGQVPSILPRDQVAIALLKTPQEGAGTF
jgi:hypothetical protein